MKNRVTIISLNFFPEDTAIGLYSTQMAEYLSRKDFEIDVITGYPYYPRWEIFENYKKKGVFLKEHHNKIRVLRYKQYVPKRPSFIKRMIHMIDFTIGSFFNLFKVHKTDLIICVVPFTTSIVLGKILSLFKRAPLWIHIQDFEFDAALQTGVSSKQGKGNIMYKLLFLVESKLLKSAKITSSISESMLNKLEEKTNKTPFFLPNWIDQNTVDPSLSKQYSLFDETKFNILYSGNVGAKQDWEFFLVFAKAIEAYTDINITLVGNGANKKELEESIVQLKNTKLYPPVPYQELRDLLCSADVHILFQKEDVVDTVMPSKLLGMMASGKPSIITGNLDSEVAKALKESKGGFYYNSGDLKTVLDSILSIKENPQKAKQIGKNARQYIVSKYSKNHVLGNLEQKIKELLNE